MVIYMVFPGFHVPIKRHSPQEHASVCRTSTGQLQLKSVRLKSVQILQPIADRLHRGEKQNLAQGVKHKKHQDREFAVIHRHRSMAAAADSAHCDEQHTQAKNDQKQRKHSTAGPTSQASLQHGTQTVPWRGARTLSPHEGLPSAENESAPRTTPQTQKQSHTVKFQTFRTAPAD